MTNQGHNISVKEAAKALGKSITTVHRYIDQGKLSKSYVTTDHGREVRLKPDEVLKLAQRLNERAASQQGKDDLFSSDNPFIINIREVLSRHERTLYKLGELTQELDNVKKTSDERIRELEEERERLQVKLAIQESAVEDLSQELERPLTLVERFLGKRRAS